MNYTLAKRLFVGLALGFFTFSFMFAAGCTAKRVVVVHEKEKNSGYSGTEHHNRKGGPPPHAPAHGYRAKHQYRYYPSTSVYYDCGRKLYFYIKGDRWEGAASLPTSLRMRLDDYVSMELETDKPYIYHSKHVKEYPPGQQKKKNKKKHKG